MDLYILKNLKHIFFLVSFGSYGGALEGMDIGFESKQQPIAPASDFSHVKKNYSLWVIPVSNENEKSVQPLLTSLKTLI